MLRSTHILSAGNWLNGSLRGEDELIYPKLGLTFKGNWTLGFWMSLGLSLRAALTLAAISFCSMASRDRTSSSNAIHRDEAAAANIGLFGKSYGISGKWRGRHADHILNPPGKPAAPKIVRHTLV